jgi:hypothetical protein
MTAKKRESAFSKFKGQKGLTKDIPADTTVAPIAPAPVAVAPAPVAVAPTPVAVAPAPVAVAPTPVAVAPTPVAVTKPKPMEKTIHCRVPDDIFGDVTALAYRALQERLTTKMPKVSPSTIVRACVEFTLRRFDGNKTEIDSIIDKILMDLSNAKKRQR